MILNEDPNNVKIIKDAHHGAKNAIPFVLFSKFYVYSNWEWASHDTLLKYTLIQHIYNIDAFEYSNRLRASRLDKIRYFGNLTDEETNKLKYLKEPEINRHVILELLPYALQGRLWKTTKTISFWNDLVYIASRKNDIIEFIKLLGENPKKYQYEIKDKLYNHEQFLSGIYVDDLNFDSSIVHTLPPEKKGEILKSKGIKPKVPIPLQFKQMIQGENVTFREFLQLY